MAQGQPKENCWCMSRYVEASNEVSTDMTFPQTAGREVVRSKKLYVHTLGSEVAHSSM